MAVAAEAQQGRMATVLREEPIPLDGEERAEEAQTGVQRACQVAASPVEPGGAKELPRKPAVAVATDRNMPIKFRAIRALKTWCGHRRVMGRPRVRAVEAVEADWEEVAVRQPVHREGPALHMAVEVEAVAVPSMVHLGERGALVSKASSSSRMGRKA